MLFDIFTTFFIPMDLLLTIIVQLFGSKLADEVEVLFNFRFSIVYIYQSRFAEHFRCIGSILDNQVRHDTNSCHFVQATSHEVEQFLVSCFLHGIGTSIKLANHALDAVLQRLHFCAYRIHAVFLQDL